ncbi:MAG: efflux RND transporter periplasmic adaptor subunit [Candidatus Sulfomarinibacteraceae bacterium]
MTRFQNQVVRRSPLLSVVVVATLFGGCRQAPEVAPPPPPEVTVATPIQKDVTVFQEFVGSTEAYRSVNIRARVQGFLDEMHFEPSAFVRKGELLFVIEPEPYEAQRDRAAAGLKAAEAGLARAESDLDRLEQAVRTNAVSQQEVTRARAERDQASAAMLQAEAELTNAEIQLEYTTVESPIDGLVSRNYVDLGNLVGAGEATLLTTVRQIDPIYAYFEVSERFIAQALDERGGHQGPGQTREMSATLLLDETGLEIEGRLDSLENTVDTGTGTIRVRGIFPNSDARVFPGFFVRVRLPGELLEDALLVEESALGTDLGGRYLMIVAKDDEGRDIVERRYVEPGPLQPDQSRVILSGLDAGETYITVGLQRARPGMPVTPKAAGSGS